MLSEYTLIDKGTWLDAPQYVTSRLRIFRSGSDDPSDLLLNPAHALSGKQASLAHPEICKAFMQWMASPKGGQKVVEIFSRNGHVLYSKAPRAWYRCYILTMIQINAQNPSVDRIGCLVNVYEPWNSSLSQGHYYFNSQIYMTLCGFRQRKRTGDDDLCSV